MIDYTGSANQSSTCTQSRYIGILKTISTEHFATAETSYPPRLLGKTFQRLSNDIDVHENISHRPRKAAEKIVKFTRQRGEFFEVEFVDHLKLHVYVVIAVRGRSMTRPCGQNTRATLSRASSMSWLSNNR